MIFDLPEIFAMNLVSRVLFIVLVVCSTLFEMFAVSVFQNVRLVLGIPDFREVLAVNLFPDVRLVSGTSGLLEVFAVNVFSDLQFFRSIIYLLEGFAVFLLRKIDLLGVCYTFQW